MGMPFHFMLGQDPEAKNASLDRDLLRRAWGFTKDYRRLISIFVVVVVLLALNGLITPLATRILIDDVIFTRDQSKLNWIAVVMLTSAFIGAGLSLIERWCSARIGEGLIFTMRTALFDHVQRMPIAFFTHSQTGALVSRLNNDVIGAQRAVTGTLGQVLSNVIVLASTVVAMLFLDWKLTGLAIIILPVFVVPAKRVGRRLQDYAREQMDLNASMNTTMTERFSVAGALLVKLFGRHPQEAAAFETKAARVRDLGVTTAMYGRTFNIALSLVGDLGVAAILLVGAHFVISGSLQVGTVVALSMLLNRLYTPLTRLTSARIEIMTALVSFERVFDVLDRPRVIEDKPNAISLGANDQRVSGDVHFENVTFTYPSGVGAIVAGSPPVTDEDLPPVLHGIDLHVRPGEMLALVGPSGAGKSTIVGLLPRLYDVDSGTISLDGQDVRDLSQDSLRQAIGFVPQDPHLFHETVEANLRYAQPDATLEDMKQACVSARIHDVIKALPDGYNTLVGERGYRLSGGEKQRLAIARLLLKDPAVVVLDEATSHLDATNELLIQEALQVALSGRTSIVIAHRLSTIRSANQIAVIEAGLVCEQGTHKQLLEIGGIYSELYRHFESNPQSGV